MESSDIYVSMYEYSNLSNTLIEAINACIPSLIIPNGKTTFLARDKVNCQFIDENNCRGSLIEKIINLYSNQDLRTTLRKSSKEFARLNLVNWEERSMIEINLF